MENVFNKCKEMSLQIYAQFDGSHDFDHIDRVIKNAELIATTEPTANRHIVRLGALLHDIDDAKYIDNEKLTAREILEKNCADAKLIDDVLASIKSVSFSGGNEQLITSIEGAIIRDADRLDAIGAIGIARAFAFGGARGRKLYNTDEDVRVKMSEEEYRDRSTATVTHFHEKLLLLKDLMVTDEGKRLAKQRHSFMVRFLEQLEQEIN